MFFRVYPHFWGKVSDSRAVVESNQRQQQNPIISWCTWMCWYSDGSMLLQSFNFWLPCCLLLYFAYRIGDQTLLILSVSCLSSYESIILISKRFEHLKSCLGYRIMQSKLCLTYCQPFSDLNGFTVYNARSKTSKFLSHRLSSDKHNIKGRTMGPKNLWCQIWM